MVSSLEKIDSLEVIVVAAMKKIVAILMAVLLVALATSGVAENAVQFNEDLLWQANSASPLPAEYEPQDLVKLTSRRSGGSTEGTVYTTSTTSIQLRAEAADALVKLCAAAEDEGMTLYVRQGYRSYAEETKRYARLEKRGEAMQKPGETDYQTGLAASVVNADWRTKALSADYADTAEGKWLADNASVYGFVLRYPENKMAYTGWEAEPWHLRYVGVEAAGYMKANDLCLEEFCAAFVQGVSLPVVEAPEMQEEEPAEIGEPAETVEVATVKKPLPEFVYVPGRVVPLDDVGPDGDWEISFIYE